MKKLMFIVVLLSSVASGEYPSYKNYDYDSSIYNYKNSPYNYNNSIYNSRRSSFYDSDGNSIGYLVPKEDGGINIYSNQGHRIGYTSSPNNKIRKVEPIHLEGIEPLIK